MCCLGCYSACMPCSFKPCVLCSLFHPGAFFCHPCAPFVCAGELAGYCQKQLILLTLHSTLCLHSLFIAHFFLTLCSLSVLLFFEMHLQESQVITQGSLQRIALLRGEAASSGEGSSQLSPMHTEPSLRLSAPASGSSGLGSNLGKYGKVLKALPFFSTRLHITHSRLYV